MMFVRKYSSYCRKILLFLLLNVSVKRIVEMQLGMIVSTMTRLNHAAKNLQSNRISFKNNATNHQQWEMFTVHLMFKLFSSCNHRSSKSFLLLANDFVDDALIQLIPPLSLSLLQAVSLWIPQVRGLPHGFFFSSHLDHQRPLVWGSGWWDLAIWCLSISSSAFNDSDVHIHFSFEDTPDAVVICSSLDMSVPSQSRLTYLLCNARDSNSIAFPIRSLYTMRYRSLWTSFILILYTHSCSSAPRGYTPAHKYRHRRGNDFSFGRAKIEPVFGWGSKNWWKTIKPIKFKV